MKSKTFILIFFIVLTVLSPIHINFFKVSGNESPILLTLNVCFTENLSLSLDYETPVIFNSYIHYNPNEFTGYNAEKPSALHELIVASTLERPPKVL
ncbi:MAG: hypothetical protein HQK91_09480 [Nitrospirae bacterium]|nr:hypothetical protein [Nitrospirota bacterium]MBF0541663.1 hypothetical protein [Nitrospirota bacterium]